MEKEAQHQVIERLNEAMAGKFPYRFALVDPTEIRLLEKNARYMDQPTFKQLVDNVARDGALTSLPLCHRQPDGSLVVLSGNHRVQAAVHAGLEEIMIMVIEGDLSRDEQVAIQLSHNSLAGKDDKVILKELWEEIEAIEFKSYAGLDSETLGALDKLEFTTLADPRPRFEQIVLQFLPEEIDDLRRVLEEADSIFSLDNNYVLAVEHYDRVFDALVDIKEKYNIVSNPAAFMKLIELARERMDETPEPEESKEEETV